MCIYSGDVVEKNVKIRQSLGRGREGGREGQRERELICLVLELVSIEHLITDTS